MATPKPEAYRRTAEHLHKAKNDLLSAIRTAEAGNLKRLTTSCETLCGRVEALENQVRNRVGAGA